MNRNEKALVTIEIYDEDGDMRESLGGEYTFRQIRSMMKNIINNDGIPVIRQLGKPQRRRTSSTPPRESICPRLR